jgi:hypothetical protein
MFAGLPYQMLLRAVVIRRCRHGLSPNGRPRMLLLTPVMSVTLRCAF